MLVRRIHYGHASSYVLLSIVSMSYVSLKILCVVDVYMIFLLGKNWNQVLESRPKLSRIRTPWTPDSLRRARLNRNER